MLHKPPAGIEPATIRLARSTNWAKEASEYMYENANTPTLTPLENIEVPEL